MKSPCINICEMNPVTGFCNGCGRTGTEISHWRTYTDQQREQIITELPHRLFGD